jgi:hypothetical protein
MSSCNNLHTTLARVSVCIWGTDKYHLACDTSALSWALTSSPLAYLPCPATCNPGRRGFQVRSRIPFRAHPGRSQLPWCHGCGDGGLDRSLYCRSGQTTWPPSLLLTVIRRDKKGKQVCLFMAGIFCERQHVVTPAYHSFDLQVWPFTTCARQCRKILLYVMWS